MERRWAPQPLPSARGMRAVRRMVERARRLIARVDGWPIRAAAFGALALSFFFFFFFFFCLGRL